MTDQAPKPSWKERKASRRAKKAEKKASRKDRQARHRLANVTVLFGDHTYVSRLVDIDRDSTVTIEGFDYEIPNAPYHHLGLWLHKPRNFKRSLVRDEYYEIDYWEKNPLAINVADEHKEYKSYWDPVTWLGNLNETTYRDSMRSQARKDQIGIFENNKILIVVLVVAGIGGYILMHFLGMI